MRRRADLALRYWRSVPLSRLWPALTGVFFIFAAVGFIMASWWIDAPRPWPAVLAQAAMSGATAVLFLMGVIRSRWFFPVALAFDLLGVRSLSALWRAGFAAGSLAPEQLPVMKERLQTIGLLAIASIALGWAFLARFIRREGTRQIRLVTEVELASDLHASLVPQLSFQDAGLEVRGLSVPSSEVGGDLVDACHPQRGLLACVADVAGHGVPAGSITAMIKGAVRVGCLSHARLEDLLAQLNELLIGIGRPDRFVTFACLQFDGAGGVEYALAGHPPILHLGHGARVVQRLENSCVPLGVRAGARFTAGRLQAAPGDLFAIFTDGLSEVRDASGREWEIEPLEAILLEHAGGTLEEIERVVFESAGRHGPRLDDQTLLLARVR